MEKQKKSRKGLMAVLILIAAIAVMAAVYFMLREKPVQGSKEITITVTHKDQSTDQYELATDAKYLQEAMDEAKEQGLTYHAEDGDYGAMVDTVNDEKAVYEENQAYWAFSVNGEYCNYGISEQPVTDGDAFGITYTVDGADSAGTANE